MYRRRDAFPLVATYQDGPNADPERVVIIAVVETTVGGVKYPSFVAVDRTGTTVVDETGAFTITDWILEDFFGGS